jgi:RNA polymerase sigma factor (sigma-70 family)
VTDNDLLMQWVEQRDPEAFREMVNRHAGMVYATCRRIVHDAVEAEDVAQECFEALAKAGARPGAYLGAWLHRVATNRSLQHLRGDIRRRIRETACVPAESTNDSAEWQEAYALVDEALNALPERLRAPLVLYYLENQTQESIAQTLGVARSTVPYRIGKGLERVRKSLHKRGVMLTSGAFAALGASAKASALPPTLAASLGKLALAGSELLPAAAVGTGFLGGLLSLKGALTVSMVVVLGVVGYETVQHKKTAPAPTTAQLSTSQPVAQEVPKDLSLAASVSGTPPSTETQPESSAAASAPGTVNVTGDLRMEGSNTPCKSLSLVFKSDTTGKELHARTETTGRFELRDAPPGSYHVFLDDTIRVLKNMPVIVNVQPGTTEARVNFTVDAGASVSGRISDKETGIAVPGAGVYVAAVKDGQNSVTGCSGNEAYTDRNGRYFFEGLRPGKYRLFLEPEITVCDAAGKSQYTMKLNGSESIDFAVTGRERLENIDFPLLLGGAPISGVVRDADGRPAAGVRVEAATRRDRQDTETQKDGTFILRGLAAAPDCRILARTDKEASEFVGPLTLPEEGLKDIQLQLRPGGVVRGTLTDGQGMPLAKNTLNAMSGFNVGTGCSTTDKDGAFQFDALPEGSYEVVLVQQAPGVFAGPNTLAKVDVKWGQVTDNVALVYKSSPAAAGVLQISGHVKDAAGQPLPGVAVDAQYSDMGVSKTAGKPAWTDADGYYQIPGLDKRVYIVFAHNASMTTSHLQEIEAGATDVDFVMQPRTSIEGRVVRADNGQPVTQFEITAPSEQPVQVAESAGRFKLARVDAGDVCRVTVKAAGFMKAEEHIEITPGKDVKDVVIKLTPAAGLSGRVLNPDGQPVSGAQIFATGGMDHVQFNNESSVLARSGADGTFQIGTLPAERGFVVASHTEYAVGSAPYRPGISTVDIVLHDGGAVIGTVTSGGAPAAGLTVSLGRLSLSTKEYNAPLSARTGPDGTFRFEQVQPGETAISTAFDKEVKDPMKIRSITKRINVESGQTLTVALDLPEATAGIEGQARLGGHPAASAFVTFTCTKDGAESPSMAQADANGFFKFEAVPAGSGTLRAMAPGSVPGVARTVSAQVETVAGQLVRQDLDTTDTGVIVADIRGVTPSPGTIMSLSVLPGEASVNAVDALLNLQIAGESVAGAVVKNDGPLRLDTLSPGTYTVTALMTNFSDKVVRTTGMASAVVTVENGAEAAVELVLQPVEE